MSAGSDWFAASYTKGRAAIFRALKIDREDEGAAYATLPFRLMHDADGQPCIGGAIGIWRAFDPKDWSPADIADVILWNPVSGKVSLHGSLGPDLVVPDRPEAKLTVYADGFAFFRAWADRRAQFWAGNRHARANHNVSLAEPADSGIAGALAIGRLDRLPWRETGASVLVAGAGIDPKDLNRAIIRSAHLPRVESMAA